MLSFNNMGRVGRLGNQMFQYAAIKGMAVKHGYQFCIPFSPDLNEWCDHQLNRHFLLDDHLIIDSPQGQGVWHERMFNFDHDLFMNCPDNIDFIGYFQTEKYFHHIREEILHDFTFKNISDHAKNIQDSLGDYITIHVRRGDNATEANKNHHPMPSNDYYASAADLFEGSTIAIVSDDIEWCKNQEFFLERGVKFVEGTNNADDLFIMSQAKHNVIANSSFSWWAAWLNQNPYRRVVAPPVWFGPALAHHNLCDILPEDWEVL